MRILAIDVGTGTQDILLFDSSRAIENCVKMVMPSPTVIAAQRVEGATTRREPLVLTGVNMGGGPVTSAVEGHLRAGLPVYAVPSAAITFDDDLEAVRRMGVILVSEDEAAHLGGFCVELKDLDTATVSRALAAFDVDPTWDALAVAVFDHGDAPPGYSDRKFRFDHLRRQVTGGQRQVTSFIYLADEIPTYLTRMRAVARTASKDAALLMMDTAEAAVLGALEDPTVADRDCKLVCNLGNEHTLAFHLHGLTIQGLFEHHTHVLARDMLEDYLVRLVQGDLDDEEIWRGQGHGAIVLEGGEKRPFLSVTGPMRGMLEGSKLAPYFATPHGDMMLAGCFGLVRAWAERREEWREEILQALRTVGEDAGYAH